MYRKGAPFRRKLDLSVQYLIQSGLVKYWLNQLLDKSGQSQRREYVQQRKLRRDVGNTTEIDDLFAVKPVTKSIKFYMISTSIIQTNTFK